jgi:hypothetical protein
VHLLAGLSYALKYRSYIMLHALEAILVGLFHGLVRIHVNVQFNVINLNAAEEGRLLPRKISELDTTKPTE